MGNFNSNKKHHFIYKTINLLSNRYYIGMHSTNDLNDGYMGSGDLIRKSIKKYGKENHSIEMLEFFDTREELANREREVINLQEIAKKDCMNLKVGGDGGFNSEDHRNKFIEASKKTRFTSENNPSPKKNKKFLSDRFKRLHKEGILIHDGFLGKKHTDETKLKMSKSSKNKYLGDENSQYKSFWITDGINNKKLKQNDKIPNGWFLGRNMKKYYK